MAKDLKVKVNTVAAKGTATSAGVVGTVRQQAVSSNFRESKVSGVARTVVVEARVADPQVSSKTPSTPLGIILPEVRVSVEISKTLLADQAMTSPFLFKYIEDTIGHSDPVHLAKQRITSNVAKRLDDTVLKIGKRFLETAAKRDKKLLSFKKLRRDLLAVNDSQSVLFSKIQRDIKVARDARWKAFQKRKADNLRFSQSFKKLFTKRFTERFGHSDDFLGTSAVGDDIRLEYRKNKTDSHGSRDSFKRVASYKRKPSETHRVVEEIRADFSKKKIETHRVVDFVKLSKIFNRTLSDAAKRSDTQQFTPNKSRKDSTRRTDTVKLKVTWSRKFNEAHRTTEDLKFSVGKLLKDLPKHQDKKAAAVGKKRKDTHAASDTFKRVVVYKRSRVEYTGRTDDLKFSAGKSAKDFKSCLEDLKFATYKLLKNTHKVTHVVYKGVTKKQISLTGIRDSVIILKTPVRKFNEQIRLTDTVRAVKQNYTTSSYFASDYVGTAYDSLE